MAQWFKDGLGLELYAINSYNALIVNTDNIRSAFKSPRDNVRIS